MRQARMQRAIGQQVIIQQAPIQQAPIQRVLTQRTMLIVMAGAMLIAAGGWMVRAIDTVTQPIVTDVHYSKQMKGQPDPTPK